MRLRTFLTLAALLVLTCSVARAQDEPQQKKEDEQVIDDFVLTRGVSFEEPGKKPGKQASPSRPQGGSKSSSKSSGSIASTKPPRKKQGTGGSEVAAMSSGGGGETQIVKASDVLRPLALGYTILMKDDTGRLFVADP